MVRLRKDYPRAFNMAIYEDAVGTLRLSQGKVPVKTGHLKRSVYLTKPSRWNSTTFKAVGGYAAHYAAEVHARHRSKAGFLSQAVNERKSGANRRIAKITRARVKTGNMAPPKSEFSTVPRG